MRNSESDRANNYNSSTLCGLIRSSLPCQSEPCFVSIRPVSFHSDLSQFTPSRPFFTLVCPSSPRHVPFSPWFVPVHPVSFHPASSQFTPSAFILVRLNSSRQLSPWFVPVYPVSFHPGSSQFTPSVFTLVRPSSPCQLSPCFVPIHPVSFHPGSSQFILSAFTLVRPNSPCQLAPSLVPRLKGELILGPYGCEEPKRKRDV